MTTLNPEEKKLSLRVLIDRERNKVVFAEADSDFVDVLFSFMTLPMGTIVRLLDKYFGPQKEAMGSFNTLYDGLKKLSSLCFWTEEAKLMLLNPRNSSETECQKLKVNIDDSEPTKYFVCEDWECIKKSYNSVPVSTYNVTGCHCGKIMNREMGLDTSNTQAASSKEGVFTTERVSFIISDDLKVTTNLAGSSFELLNSLGIKDMAALQEKTCILGSNEIINLLKCSIISKTPLSDVILYNKPRKSETFFSVVSQTIPKNSIANTRKMVLKAMVHKSTKKILFAQAEEDFIDFLFSFPTIPLGSVVSVLYGNTSLGSIGNLYKSISSLNADRYLKRGVNTMLLNPKLSPQYLCKNQILLFLVTSSRELIYKSSLESGKNKAYLFHKPYNFMPSGYYPNITWPMSLKDPKGGRQQVVRGPAMFMVTDDLEVTPMSPISCISFLNRLGIPFCDVEERAFNIGTEEALGILRASFGSSSALTNGLNLALKKQPKQET